MNVIILSSIFLGVSLFFSMLGMGGGMFYVPILLFAKTSIHDAAMSVFFISSFVYFNFYRFNLKGNVLQYLKRIIATYGLSLLAVGLFLTVIMKCPWGLDDLLAIKRILLIAFPASMAATLSDTIKNNG